MLQGLRSVTTNLTNETKIAGRNLSFESTLYDSLDTEALKLERCCTAHKQCLPWEGRLGKLLNTVYNVKLNVFWNF